MSDPHSKRGLFVLDHAHSMAEPYVVDEEGLRMLHFDIRSVQSCMRMDDPVALVYTHTKIMMGFLLLQSSLDEILLLGLGGGSIAKYCYHRLSNSRITAIEISDAVIALRKKFFIPDDNDRFRVVHADAYAYIEGKHEVADVILLDAFEPWGLPSRLCQRAFYQNCYWALRPGGVLVVNLWGGWLRLFGCRSRLRRCFGERMRWVTDPQTGEHQIVFGLKDSSFPSLTELRRRAAVLQSRVSPHLDLSVLVEQLQAGRQ